MMHSTLGVTKLLCLQNIANPIAMSVFVSQEKITVQMGLQSDPIDPTKMHLNCQHFNFHAMNIQKWCRQ